MKPEEYARLFRLERDYWWFVGRQELARRLLHSSASPSGPQRLQRILDLGCGAGALSERLSQEANFHVVSADFSRHALGFCQQRGLPRLVAADAMRLPFVEGTFDAVVALDVLEHVSDDHAALREIRRVLHPGGVLVASVPAYPSLWSAHDVALMHYRRYLADDFGKRVETAGLRIVHLSYAMTLLFPALWAARRISRLLRGGHPSTVAAQLPPVPGWLNQALIRLLRLENRLVVRGRLPFGASVVCVARRV